MAGAHARWHWVLAAAGGVAGLVAVLALFQSPRPPIRPESAQRPGVRLDPSPTLRDEAAFFDPTPMFLPTSRNASSRVGDSVQREPTATFRDYPAKLGFGLGDVGVDALALPKSVRLPPGPPTDPRLALAADPPGSVAAGIGHADSTTTELPDRTGFVEIVASDSGKTVFTRRLAKDTLPAGQDWWQPVEFLAAVDAAGLVGPLVQTVRSGADEVDSRLQNYLVRTLRVGARLPPGYYRISVGP
ncbi:MAG: hypothetical protein RLZZ15_3960 [Verrucomicrobiota bacterium]|jgi:hypothetical protein